MLHSFKAELLLAIGWTGQNEKTADEIYARTFSLLREMEDQYYNGIAQVKDSEYDDLKRLAKKAWPARDAFKVGAAVKENTPWEKKKHKIVMGSIENISVDSKDTWIEDTLRNGRKWWESLGKPQVLIQPKLDGLSLNLEYENGELQRAILRGDGKEGEDILRNAKQFKGVYEVLHVGIGNVRGEVVIYKEDLKILNNLKAAAGEKEYTGCRAAAAGLARGFDGLGAPHLHFIAFDIQRNDTYWDDSKILSEYSFAPGVRVHSNICDTWEQVQELYHSILNERSRYSFEMDGAVVKVNDLRLRTDKSDLPEWARALKFPPEEQLFRVDEINWYVGKSGKLTPVAHNKDGVKFATKTVREVTLHNLDLFKKYDIHQGDDIAVTISMDVIPKIDRVVNHNKGEEFEWPLLCPVCNTNTKQEGAFLYCPNVKCSGIRQAKLESFVKAYGIDDIGPELIRKMCMADLVNEPADFFKLTGSGLFHLEGVQGKMAVKIVKNIQAKREVSLEVFIDALSIPGIGERVVEKSGLNSINEAMGITAIALASKEGIGMITASEFVKGLQENAVIIGNLLAYVKITPKKVTVVEKNIFQGKSFCFTGDAKEENPDTHKTYDREELWELVRKYGGEVKSGVSKKLDYLVLADMSLLTTKAKKARDYGTTLISVFDFLKMAGLR